MERVGTDALDQFKAVHVAHFEVGDDGGYGTVLENFPGSFGAEGGEDVDVLHGPEQYLKRGGAGVDIVDHQYVAAHFSIIGEGFPTNCGRVVKSL